MKELNRCWEDVLYRDRVHTRKMRVGSYGHRREELESEQTREHV